MLWGMAAGTGLSEPENLLMMMPHFPHSSFFCCSKPHFGQAIISDGSTFAAFDIDYDGDLANDINTALLCLPYKGRLLLLRTTEKGNDAWKYYWNVSEYFWLFIAFIGLLVGIPNYLKTLELEIFDLASRE